VLWKKSGRKLGAVEMKDCRSFVLCESREEVYFVHKVNSRQILLGFSYLSENPVYS